MSQCKQCGAQLDAGVKVCPQCGSVLEGNLVANEQYDSNLSREMDESKRKEQQRRSKLVSRLSIVGWLGFFVIAAIIVVSALSYGDVQNFSHSGLTTVCLIPAAILCFFTRANGGSVAAVVVSVLWAVAVCFVAATIHYTLSGYSAVSAGETWRYFGGELFMFAIAIALSTLAGRAIVPRCNVVASIATIAAALVLVIIVLFIT